MLDTASLVFLAVLSSFFSPMFPCKASYVVQTSSTGVVLEGCYSDSEECRVRGI